MTLDQLHAFVEVARREHLTRAAEALNLTPSAVSASIRTLEARHAVQLFDRIGRRMELSVEGRAFLQEALVVLAGAASAEQALREMAGLMRGSLRIAASKTVASHWLPRILLRFAERHPGISLTLHEFNTAGVAAAVREGRTELGFVEGAIDDPTLIYEFLVDDPLTVVSSPGNPLVSAGPISLADLAAARWVMRERGSGARSVVETAFKSIGIDPDGLSVLLELPTNEALCTAASFGRDVVAAIPEVVTRGQIGSGRLVKLDVDLPGGRYALVRHRERFRSHVSRAMEEFVKSSVGASNRADRS